MRCQRTILVTVAVAGLTAAAPANYLILGSSTATTAVVGGDGTDSRLIGSGDYQGLYRTDWKEDSDIPCYFRVHTRHLNQDGVQSQDWNLGGASCDETDRSERSVGYNKPG